MTRSSIGLSAVDDEGQPGPPLPEVQRTLRGKDAAADSGSMAPWGNWDVLRQAGTTGFDSEYSVRGDRSVPLGQTIVPTSGSALTCLNKP